MTDITDDIAEEISFQGFEDDCRLLGNLLNDVLQRELGPEFMDKLERTRVLAQVFAIFAASQFLLWPVVVDIVFCFTDFPVSNFVFVYGDFFLTFFFLLILLNAGSQFVSSACFSLICRFRFLHPVTEQ